MAQVAIIAAKNVLLATRNALVALVCLLTMMIQIPPNWVYVSAKHPDQYPLMGCPNDEEFLRLLALVFPLTIFAYAGFGGVHCIAWNFAPYSQEVQALWRAASLAVTVFPLVSQVLVLLANSFLRLGHLTLVISLVGFMVTIVYSVARIVLLILPFLELTRLPANAFKTVSWDDFFPHIA
jgi:hypothetical protein